jgi:hypothetical protein
MTIFLMVLKKLIKDQLSPVSTNLAYQSKAFGYNQQCSKDQKLIIDDLGDKLVLFQGTGDDEADSKEIVKLLEAALRDIQAKRESHGEPKDQGKTVGCLKDLIFHTRGFYEKLVAYKFSLLDKEYTETPENIVYFHSAVYFGDDIFTPKANIDVEIRNKKEDRLAIRLKSLSELIKPGYSFEEQKERTLQVLQDLAADNKLVIKGDNSNVAVPGLSFWGFQITAPTEWFSAGEGRFAEEFNMAVRRIKEMKPEQFVKPVAEHSM